MDRNNVDKYGKRTVAGQRVTNAETWGRGTARDRYGPLDYADKAPPEAKNMTKPQFRENQQGPRYSNNVPENSWLRGGGKGGEGYKYFDRGKKR